MDILLSRIPPELLQLQFLQLPHVHFKDYQTLPDSGLGAGRSTAYDQCHILRMGPSHNAGGPKHH